MATDCPNCGMELPSGSPLCPRCTTAEPSGARDPFLGKVVGGRYRILRLLGRGGMGVVYEAEHVGVGQRVAIKFLHATFCSDPEVVRRFGNEARSYAQINHPHAVQLHDFAQDEQGHLYISMEFVEGLDLKQTLARERRLPPGDAVEIALQICDVLAAAHAKGIVHRDLKPENIMLTRALRGPHVTVLDFGLAHLADGGARLTAPGMVCGTPRYMPPEQAEGGEVDHRADVYALGLVLFEALSGIHPFDSPSITETLRRQITEPVPPLAQAAPDLPPLPRLDAAIQRATAKRREDRFASMLDFARALGEEARPSPSASAPTAEETGATSVRLTPSQGAAPAAGERPAPSADAEERPDRTLPSAPRREAAPPPEPAPAPKPRTLHAGLLAGLAVLALGALAAGILVRGGPDPEPLRERLDAAYRASREPLPPPECAERDPAVLAALLGAAAHLAEAIPEGERAAEAEKALAALAGRGGSAEGGYLLAKAQFLAGRPAAQALAPALACPGFAAAQSLAGALAQREGRVEEAERRYRAAVEAAPGYARPQLNWAILEFGRQDLDGAVRRLEAALALEPDFADAHFALGLARETRAGAARAAGEEERAAAEAAQARRSFCRAGELGHLKARGRCAP